MIDDKCKEIKCEHYIEWSFGYGMCHSCKLQGESYNIEKPAEDIDCPLYGIRRGMKHEERDLEMKCVQLARRRGWDCWKNENNGNKGIPDYSFLKGGRFVMVEFKRSATAHIRPEQLTWQARHPETVFFCHDIETFTKILEL